MRDEGEDYARRLDGLIHAAFSMAGVIPRARDFTVQIGAFLDDVLGRAEPQQTRAAGE